MTALTGYLKDTAEPAMEKLIRSGEILASRVQGHQETIKVFENQSALLRETLAPVFQQLEVKPSPLFSEAVSTFMTSPEIKTKPNSELAMMTNVYRRWIEINGDEPIRTYSSKHANKYIEMMTQIPGTYGKGKTKELTVDELIKYAKRNRIKALLKTKTIKNHFSKMSILWTFHEKKELVNRGSNVFKDWSFGRKLKGDGYKAWPEDDLRKLIDTPWPPGQISQRTFGMIVGIGSYTGMRLEEICRLRKLDVINIKGVWCFNICEHLPRRNRPAEAWNPKTEAGERVIPIHHKLIEAGILEWAKSANYYLFNELTFSGRDKKRSVGFGGKFSTFKNRLGIKSSTIVFHSFRHNVSTKLRNTPGGDTGIRELWIDDFLGHEYGHHSEGVKRYLDGIDLENIVQVAESMQYPDFWDIRTLMGEA
ncbi:tyrosine-type recombinase/integrase [Acetobacter oryzifermentans]|uniref:tyrosine-type recombinase/integrase n=1 Tax=Acetobacter oryzifermentans TaxID=1633874 RepID=UPI000AA5CAD1|nr:tyrosine-type recombinase/integrase [Acetobacter oryzifermentans]